MAKIRREREQDQMISDIENEFCNLVSSGNYSDAVAKIIGYFSELQFVAPSIIQLFFVKTKEM